MTAGSKSAPLPTAWRFTVDEQLVTRLQRGEDCSSSVYSDQSNDSGCIDYNHINSLKKTNLADRTTRRLVTVRFAG